APALVVDADRQRRLAQLLDLVGQGQELLHVLEIAGKQDHAARGRVAEAPAVVVGPGPAGPGQHPPPEGRAYLSDSMVTGANAMPRSSERDRWAFETFLFRRSSFSSSV